MPHTTVGHHTQSMDIRFLVTFLEVAKHRHFGIAAENLYLTQSAVSARIKLLEEYFNTPLFVRHRSSIQLTAAGEKLIPFAEQLAGTLESARKTLGEEDVEYVVFASSPNATDISLHRALQRINLAFPEISTRADVLAVEQLTRQLLERQVHLALSLIPLKAEDIENIAIETIPLALYRSINCNNDNAMDNYLHIDWGNKVTDYLQHRYPATRRAKLKTGAYPIAVEYLLSNSGCLVLPKTIAQQNSLSSQLVLMEELPDVDITVYLSYLKEAKLTGLEDLIAFLQSN
ncbi:LysR family transcriptional regulator [Alteromonadaceae bacterium BrNp21-10]|nr:LysR family transcriptional regulator [Alteromonadaceae bacterium BrNp21-10]